MLRKLGIVIVGLCLVAVFTLKANAQQTTPSANPQGQGRGAQLRQEIRQRIETLRHEEQEIVAKIKELRERLNSIRERIRRERERLQGLRGGQQGHHGQGQPNAQPQQQPASTPAPTSTATTQQK